MKTFTVKLWFEGYKKWEFIKIASTDKFCIITEVDNGTITMRPFGSIKYKWWNFIKLTWVKGSIFLEKKFKADKTK